MSPSAVTSVTQIIIIAMYYLLEQIFDQILL